MESETNMLNSGSKFNLVGKFNISEVEISLSASGLDTISLVIIIVTVVIVVVIMVVAIWLCLRKKPVPQEDQEQHVEIQIKQGESNSAQLKQFIKAENQSNAVENKDAAMNRMDVNQSELAGSTFSNIGDKSLNATERKLISNQEKGMSMRDSFREQESEQAEPNDRAEKKTPTNLTNIEASFRNDLYKIDTQGDKIKALIEGNLRPSEHNMADVNYYKPNEKTTKDIAAENIYNYTDGNRGDFYSEAAEENDPDIDNDPEVDYTDFHKKYYHQNNKENITFKNRNSNLTNKASLSISNNKTNPQTEVTNTKYTSNQKDMEQDMSPDEFYEDDEEENEEYKNYINNMNNYKNSKTQNQKEHKGSLSYKADNGDMLDELGKEVDDDYYYNFENTNKNSNNPPPIKKRRASTSKRKSK